MSRPLRIQYSDAWYHVMNRGRRGEAIFTTKEDYWSFVDLLGELDEVFNVKIAAYCLMSSHYHLLVQTPDANLSRSKRGSSLPLTLALFCDRLAPCLDR